VTGPDEERQRQVENLRAVYSHLRGGAPQAVSPAAPAPPASDPATARSRKGIVGTLVAAGAILLGKLKLFGILVSALKLKTLLSMGLTVGMYATQWGFPFALGFVLLVFVHEMGHVIQLHREGIPASAPVFIPFIGAFVAMRGLPRNAFVEAKVGIAGPILGSLGAWAVLAAGMLTGRPSLAALAHVALLINLFNLILVSPLDGGRVAGAFPRPFWIAGYAIGIAALVATRSPLLLLVLAVGLWTLWQRWRSPVPGYDALTAGQRWTMALAYAGLIAAILATLPVAARLAA
jgi:Zn-dependent protease